MSSAVSILARINAMPELELGKSIYYLPMNCPNCGQRISQTAKLCTTCANIQTAKVERNSEIYALYKAGWTLVELAKKFNLSPQRVSKIVERERINAR